MSSSKDPLISLNYAVFLYQTGDKTAASKQFSAYEQRLQSLEAKVETDPEVRTSWSLNDCFKIIISRMWIQTWNLILYTFIINESNESRQLEQMWCSVQNCY